MSKEEQAKPLNIYQRVNAVMADVPYVQKVQRKTGLQYTFVTRDAVVSKLRAAMVKHGIAYFPHVVAQDDKGNRISLTVSHTYVNTDNPDDRIVFETVGFGIDPQDKGPGKAVTYAEKLAHLKLFMIEAGDEDECEHYDEPFKPEEQPSAETPNASDKDLKKCGDMMRAIIKDYASIPGKVVAQDFERQMGGPFKDAPVMELIDAIGDVRSKAQLAKAIVKEFPAWAPEKRALEHDMEELEAIYKDIKEAI